MQKIKPANYVSKITVLGLLTTAIFILIFKLFEIEPTELLKLDQRWFWAAIIVTLFFPVFSSLRWFYLLEGADIKVRFYDLFKMVWGAWILSVIPGRLGDFARVVGLPEHSNKTVALGTVFLEKVIDIFILLAIGLAGLIIIGNFKVSGVVLATMFAGCLCLITLGKIARLAPKRFEEKISLLKEALVKIKDRPSCLAKSALSSFVNWMLSILQVYFLFLAVGQTVSMTSIMAWLPISIFAGLIPITIAGMGTRDSALIYFFLPLATAGSIITVGIWYSLLGYWVLSVVGFVFTRSLLKNS